jgi:opacity protein-like surface antigen
VETVRRAGRSIWTEWTSLDLADEVGLDGQWAGRRHGDTRVLTMYESLDNDRSHSRGIYFVQVWRGFTHSDFLQMKRHFSLACALVLLFAAGAAAQESEPRFRTVPWAVWGGAGTDFDSWSVSLGVRRGGFGLGAGYRYNTSTVLPSFSTETPPSGVSGDQSFQVSSVGLDLYTMQSFADFLNLYATIGGYADINTILVKNDSTQQWYLSENSPDWTNARIAYGGGLELTSLDPLLIGLGYHSVRGFNIHLGYTW